MEGTSKGMRIEFPDSKSVSGQRSSKMEETERPQKITGIMHE